MTIETSAQISQAMDRLKPFMDWALEPPISDVGSRPGSCDFLFGNPHDVAPEGYLAAVRSGIEPRGPRHYAYAMNEDGATETVAASLRERFGLPFTPDDVIMTNGNFTGLGVLLRVLVDQGDEVIFISPPWFFYETLIVAAGATPVRVLADRTTFDLDLAAIEAAITSRTRAIIVNSPNNPSGRVYRRADLDALGELLTRVSERHGRPIHLLSDEAYSRILFDGIGFDTPVASYPYSFLIYTYGEGAPRTGNRLGYIAMSPSMPERDSLVRPTRSSVSSRAGGRSPWPACSTRSASLTSGPRTSTDSSGGATWSGWSPRTGLRARGPRGHVLRPRAVARGRRRGVRAAPDRHGVWVLPGCDVRVAGTVPDLAHGERRHGGVRGSPVRRRRSPRSEA